MPPRLLAAGALTAMFCLGCLSSPTGGTTSSGNASSAAASSGTSSTTGGAITSNTGGSSSGSTSSGGEATGTGGTTTGISSLFVDGGYVFCSAYDAGWMCNPGTYFCDSANPGECFQCTSDSDCTDATLPTFDPGRPRCDIASGVPGYEHFCQQCLGDPDCAGNRDGLHCNLDPSIVEPSITGLGFETCGPEPTSYYLADCESDAGCLCSTNLDCWGPAPGSQVVGPYCVEGHCSSCQGGSCAYQACVSDLDCGSLIGADGGLICDTTIDRCGCLTSGDCGSFWPICESFHPLGVSDGGSVQVGVCGCDNDVQCGDAGLQCLPSGSSALAVFVCALSCTDPRVSPCGSVNPTSPICDPDAGACQDCSSDDQCQTSQAPGGPFCRYDGACGCRTESDCPAGEVCQPPLVLGVESDDLLGSCAVPPLCTPGSCAGVCVEDAGGCNTYARCLSDYDCVREDAGGSYCVAVYYDLFCAECRSDADCTGSPHGPECNNTLGNGELYACSCLFDSECPAGESCSIPDGEGSGDCTSACGADAGCPSGYFCDPHSTCRPRCDDGNRCRDPDPTCDTDNRVGQNGMDVLGTATGVIWCYPCLQGSDCPSPLGCGSGTGFECAGCVQDSDCGAGETCLTGGACQPSCDAGRCPSGLACDTRNLAGNGPNICYQCASPLDCPVGQGCDHLTHTCGTCEGPNAQGGPFDCPPGDICSNYWASFRPGVCLQGCDVRPCPADQPICSIFPQLTPNHAFCFGCVQDSDCGDAGARCDVSVDLTFSCKEPPD